jgi:1,6-anhydro-N-acetylmuramate kinase
MSVKVKANLNLDNEVWDRFYKILMNRTFHNGSASAWVEARMREYIAAWDTQHMPAKIPCLCGAENEKILGKCPKCGREVREWPKESV